MSLHIVLNPKVVGDELFEFTLVSPDEDETSITTAGPRTAFSMWIYHPLGLDETLFEALMVTIGMRMGIMDGCLCVCACAHTQVGANRLFF